MSEENHLPWVDLPEGVSLLTGDLCAFFGGCEKCPGHAKTGVVNPELEDAGATVLCNHWCHQIPYEA